MVDTTENWVMRCVKRTSFRGCDQSQRTRFTWNGVEWDPKRWAQ